MLRVLALVLLLGPPAGACDTALLLAIDVSGSIDGAEYELQAEGLAAALTDPQIADILVQGQVALAVMQWSGLGEQALVQPWRRMLDLDEVARFAAAAAATPRAFVNSETAVGEAISVAIAQFPAVADCQRRVIDISGDGPENAGNSVSLARREAIRAGIEINAIPIEESGLPNPVSVFYARLVITPNGFVMTARGLRDYPKTLRAKLLRELQKPVG
jgi:Ca-activated chloride channel homolog